MEHNKVNLIKLINQLYRYTQCHIDEVLTKFNLSSGTYPFLLVLNNKEGVSQNFISKELSVDKSMSARAIKRLLELGYVKKEENETDCRACKLFLTDKAKKIIPDIITEINNWIDEITGELNNEEKERVISFLDNILSRAKQCKKDR